MKIAKNILLTSAIAASSLVAMQANAALITNWNFDLTSAWKNPAPASVTESNDVNNDGVVGSSTLKWGEDGATGADGWDVADVAGGAGFENINNDTNTTNDQSTLFIQNPVIAGASLNLVDQGGGVYSSGNVDGTLFYHLNNILTNNAGSPPSLTGADLEDFFRLTGAGFELTTNPTFNVLFKETPNQAPCPGANVTTCDDIFAVTNPALLQESFMHQGYIYKLTIGATGLGLLDNASCAAAGAPAGCIGLKTAENGNNPVQFFINLTAQIPTPTSLALLGAGLLGLGAFARKQSKKS